MAAQPAAGSSSEAAVYRFMRLDAVMDVTGQSKSTIYEQMAAGLFPRPVKLGDGSKSVAWLDSEIAEWQRRRIEARDKTGAAS